MDDKTLNQELRQFDFSLCHPVREKLLDKLLAMQQQKNSQWHSAKMSDEELDWVAAAADQNHETNPFEPDK